jgi:hypothetical protein
MDIKSLNNQLTFENERKEGIQLVDLFTSCFRYDNTVELNNYTITKDDQMRPDLIIANMYNVEGSPAESYLENIDVIFYINGIDNVINLVEGLTLQYPNYEDIERFRIQDVNEDLNKKSKISERLSFSNKKTRKDSSREQYKSNESLPPTVLSTPKDPANIKDGKFTIGGL